MAMPKPMKSISKHVKDVRHELKKVHWPNRKQVYLFTTVVLGAVVTIGIFFWILDTGFTAALRLLVE